MLVFLTWLSISCIFYAYLGYPLLLLVLCAVGRAKPVLKSSKTEDVPSVSVIIAARNEKSTIAKKIENTLALQYPIKDHVQILVASDCSDDGTDDIVRSYKKHGVLLVSLLNREGKERAQAETLKQSRGEIVVFTDARSMLRIDALENIVAYFSDPTVGAVSSVDQVIEQEQGGSGERMYVQYEMWLRKLESLVGTLIGLSGSCFAVRRVFCDRFRVDVPSDFNLLLQGVERGYRGVHGDDVVCTYESLKTEELEFVRKVRTVLRGMSTLFSFPKVMNPVSFGAVSLQMISHKLFRWLVPFFIIISGLCLFFLRKDSMLYAVMFYSGFIFFSLAILGYIFPALRKSKVCKLPLFFSVTNLAILVAWWRYLTGRRSQTWEPTTSKI